LKDLYRQIDNNLLKNWNGWFSTTSTEKGRWYNDIERLVGKVPWYDTGDMTNRNTRTINRIIAEWVARMKVTDTGLCEQCNVQADIHHILYICPRSRYSTSRAKYDLLEGQTAIKTIYAKVNPESWKQVIYFQNEIKM
jgi:hypothetical protein